MEEFDFSDSDSSLHEAYDDYLQMQDPELDQILQEYGEDLDHLRQEYLHCYPELPRRINPDILMMKINLVVVVKWEVVFFESV